MPDLIKLYIRHSAIGFGIAALFVVILLYFNVQNLWTLISQDQSAVLVLFILWFFNGLLFASVQFGYAVMNLAEPSDQSGGGRPRNPILIPQRVMAQAAAKRPRPTQR